MEVWSVVPANCCANVFPKNAYKSKEEVMWWLSLLGLPHASCGGAIRPKIVMWLFFMVLAVMTSALAQSGLEKNGEAVEAVGLTNLGFTYAKVGQYTKALEALKRAVQLEPELAEAHYFLGATYNNLGLHREAVKAFKEAIRLKPTWAEAYSGLGVAYNCSMRFGESVEALQQAIRLTPGWAQPYVNLSVTYTNQHRFKEAVEASQQAIRLKADEAESYYRLGVAYGHPGK